MEVTKEDPLASSIDVNIEGMAQFCIAVDYPWKPEICTQCNVFGHNANRCTTTKVWKQRLPTDSASGHGGPRVPTSATAT